MDTMGDRLRQARIAANIPSARAAALKHGWKTSTYAAHENGQNEYDPQAAATYAKAFKTTGAWLLTGDGAQRPNGAGRKSVVSSYDPDAPEQPLDPDAPASVAFPPDAIKELANKAGMGSGQTISTTYVRGKDEITTQDAVLDEYWRLPPPFVRSVLGTSIANLLIVECDGDSMRPTLEPKARVIVDTARREISPDGLYAIRNHREDVEVKRLEIVRGKTPRVMVISDNPIHGRQEVGLDEITVVGKVVMGLMLF